MNLVLFFNHYDKLLTLQTGKLLQIYGIKKKKSKNRRWIILEEMIKCQTVYGKHTVVTKQGPSFSTTIIYK